MDIRITLTGNVRWSQYEHDLHLSIYDLPWRAMSGKFRKSYSSWPYNPVRDCTYGGLRRDLSEKIKNNVSIISNILNSNVYKKMAANDDQMRPLSLLKEIRALRFMFETVHQRICEFENIYKHSTCMYMFYEEKLLKILNELEETNTLIDKLLEKVKYVADLLTSKDMYMHAGYSDGFIYDIHVLNPVISSVRVLRKRISMLDTSMEVALEYAEIIRYYYDVNTYMYAYISIIVALLLFICQSSLESAADMKQLMIFATVIHLIISGDVESNPGPQYNARDLYGKEPKISDFQRIFIQSRAAHHWQIFGRALDIDVNDLINCSQPASVMIGTVFERWSDKHQDFTWGTIIEACEGYDQFGRVRRAIDKFLSSHRAHETYGDEPDFESQRRSKNDHSTGHNHQCCKCTCTCTHQALIFIIIILCSIISILYVILFIVTVIYFTS